jgi:hypothetical protein
MFGPGSFFVGSLLFSLLPVVILLAIVATVALSAIVFVVLFLAWALWGIRTIRRTLVAEAERNAVALMESLSLAAQYSVAAGSLVDQLERETRADRAMSLAQELEILLAAGDGLRDGQVVDIEAPPRRAARVGVAHRHEPALPPRGQDRRLRTDALRVVTVAGVERRTLADAAIDEVGALG